MIIKKIRKIILSAVIAVLGITPISAKSEENTNLLQLLNAMSDEQCYQEIKKLGYEDNFAYETETETAEAVKTIVAYFAKGGTLESLPFNYSGLVEMAVQIHDIFVENNIDIPGERYTLVNSTVYGTWNNSYNYQNCYGYSIGKSIFQDPGYYSGNSFSMSLSISSMADRTISDLQTLGYTAYKTTVKPSSLQNFQHVICIRKGSIDYHFMKGVSLSLWRHKPGATNPLQWKYSNPGYTTWTNEHSVNNISYAGNTTYTSTIYYIVYYLSNLGDSIIQDQ